MSSMLRYRHGNGNGFDLLWYPTKPWNSHSMHAGTTTDIAKLN